MELTIELKKQIDDMSFEELLHKYRFNSIGEHFWIGPSCTYAIARMRELKAKLPMQEQIDISRRVGFCRTAYRHRGDRYE